MKWMMMAWLVLGGVVYGAEKPNVLFIFADDMAFSALGAVGHEVKTPHLDRLMREGTSFERAYNPGAWTGAVCVSSRTMLMTGHQLWQAQAHHEETWKDFQSQKLSWPQLMAAAGYETYMTGKWHVRMKANEIFHHTRNIRPGMPKTVEEAYLRPVEGKKDVWDSADHALGGFWEGGKHWSEVEADTAVEYLEQAAQSEHPFFFYLAFNAPHDPRQAPQEYLEMYPVESMNVPSNFKAHYPYRDPMLSPHELRDERLAPLPRTTYAVKVHRREYYAMISHLDAQIGRVLKALDDSGQRENTYVVFSADHGLAVGRHGLMGKQNMYDHSLRVPWVIRGPGVAAGQKVSAPIYLQDIMPTTLEWAGAKIPEHVRFRSVQPLLEGTGKAREEIYGAYRDGQRALIKGDYKLIVYPKAKKARLFDLRNDPDEMTDLLEKEASAHQTRAQAMLNELESLEKEMGGDLSFEVIWK